MRRAVSCGRGCTHFLRSGITHQFDPSSALRLEQRARWALMRSSKRPAQRRHPARFPARFAAFAQAATTNCGCFRTSPPVVHRHWAPRSCGDRHCPRCLADKSRQWLQKQTESLLPIAYYHCVFTLPAELNSIVLANQRKLYPLLFDSAAQSLLQLGRNRLRGDIGISAVLHTWGKKLDFHPHLHCIVTGGALSPDCKGWRSPKQRKFLFPVLPRVRLGLLGQGR